MVVAGALAAVAFRYGRINLAVFAASIAGACIGFCGLTALAWGAAFAALAVLGRGEFPGHGRSFIIEALSVYHSGCQLQAN